MNEERMSILNMIAQGTITPEEGEKLLRALDEGNSKSQSGHHRNGSVPPLEPDDFENTREFRDESDWEKGFERFMDGFSRKIEKFAENFGGDFERKAEMMAEDLAANLGEVFGYDSGKYQSHGHRPKEGSSQFKGIPLWGLEGGLEGDSIDISSGEIDVSGLKGVVILTGKSRSVDLRIDSVQEGDNLLFEPAGVSLAINRNGWVILEFTHDGEIVFPENRIRLAVLSQRGDVTINVPLPDLVATSVNGDMFVTRLSGPAHVKTINGDINIEADQPPMGKIDISTINGDIKCQLPSRANLDFTLKTVQGDIDTSGAAISIKGGYDRPANHLKTGTLGGGSEGSLLISTIQGDILLESVE